MSDFAFAVEARWIKIKDALEQLGTDLSFEAILDLLELASEQRALKLRVKELESAEAERQASHGMWVRDGANAGRRASEAEHRVDCLERALRAALQASEALLEAQEEG